MRPENQDIRVNQMLKNLMPRSEREIQYINDALEGTGMFFCAFEGREYLINQDKKKIIYTVNYRRSNEKNNSYCDNISSGFSKHQNSDCGNGTYYN